MHYMVVHLGHLSFSICFLIFRLVPSPDINAASKFSLGLSICFVFLIFMLSICFVDFFFLGSNRLHMVQ
jgi:hypothetical protein